MKLRLTALALLLTAALTGCGLFGGAGNDLRADLDPTQIGFEVSGDSVDIFSNSVTFRNPPGAAVATITGYEIQVYDNDDNEYIGANSELHNYHLAIEVPAGYTCPDGETQTCEPAQRILQAMTSETQSFVFLDKLTAFALLNSGESRARAEITFFADQAGRAIEWTQSVTVTYPVDGS